MKASIKMKMNTITMKAVTMKMDTAQFQTLEPRLRLPSKAGHDVAANL